MFAAQHLLDVTLHLVLVPLVVCQHLQIRVDDPFDQAFARDGVGWHRSRQSGSRTVAVATYLIHVHRCRCRYLCMPCAMLGTKKKKTKKTSSYTHACGRVCTGHGTGCSGCMWPALCTCVGKCNLCDVRRHGLVCNFQRMDLHHVHLSCDGTTARCTCSTRIDRYRVCVRASMRLDINPAYSPTTLRQNAPVIVRRCVFVK